MNSPRGCPEHRKTRGVGGNGAKRVGGSGAENVVFYSIFCIFAWRRLAPFCAVQPRSAPFNEGGGGIVFLWFLAPSAAHGGVFGEAVADPPGDGHTEQQVIPRTPSQQLRVSFSGDLESAFPVISRSFDSCGSDTASRVPSALRRDSMGFATAADTSSRTRILMAQLGTQVSPGVWGQGCGALGPGFWGKFLGPGAWGRLLPGAWALGPRAWAPPGQNAVKTMVFAGFWAPVLARTL